MKQLIFSQNRTPCQRYARLTPIRAMHLFCVKSCPVSTPYPFIQAYTNKKVKQYCFTWNKSLCLTKFYRPLFIKQFVSRQLRSVVRAIVSRGTNRWAYQTHQLIPSSNSSYLYCPISYDALSYCFTWNSRLIIHARFAFAFYSAFSLCFSASAFVSLFSRFSFKFHPCTCV